MNTVEVVITAPFEDSLVARLPPVSPRLRVRKVEDMVRREIQLLRRSPGSAEQLQATADLDAVLRDAEVMLSGFRMPENVPARTPRLKWVQSMAAGVERYLASLSEAGVTLTNARGVAATPLAEWVLCAMLMFAKNMQAHQRRKQQRLYQRTDVLPFSLEGKSVGVLGLGAIGGEIARLSRALGMRVLATRRTAAEESPPHVDRLYPPSQTDEVLRASDFVALALPLVPDTVKLIAERELRLMKPTAYIMNVGRGPSIDEAALARALKEGWIAGAALDVFEKEPLPPESPLWGLDNLIFSPHISGEVDDYDERVARLFAENLRRYVSGEPLLNVVDKAKGY